MAEISINTLDKEYGLAARAVEVLRISGCGSIPQVAVQDSEEAFRVVCRFIFSKEKVDQFTRAVQTCVVDHFGLDPNGYKISARLVNPAEIQREFRTLANNAEPRAQSHPNLEIETKKRRVVNALIQGGAHGFQEAYHLLSDDIIENDVKKAFRVMMNFGDRQYYDIPSELQAQMAADPQHVAGLSYFAFTGNHSVEITARATLPPVLLHEVGKGVLECESYCGLPQDIELKEAVLAAADRREFEHKDFQIGLPLWKMFRSWALQSGAKTPPEILDSFVELVKLEPKRFFDRIKVILEQSKI